MSSKAIGKPIEILLVEDNPGDVRLTKEALIEGKVLNKLHVVEDGVEALAFLNEKVGMPMCLGRSLSCSI